MNDRLILAILVMTIMAGLIWVGIAFVGNEANDSELDKSGQKIESEAGLKPSRSPVSAKIHESIATRPSDTPAAVPEEKPTAESDKKLARVHVKVFNHLTSKPLVGLGLTLSRLGILNRKKPVSKHRTNENGEFFIERLPAGIYLLETVGVTDHERFVLASGENKVVLFGVMRSVSFSGRCVDEKGEGVPGASIYISAYTFQPTLGTVVAESDENGNYRIVATDPGRFIQARKIGWSPSPLIKLENDYDVKGIAPLRLLSNGAKIHGILRSGLAPVAGSTVTLTELDIGDSDAGQEGSISLETISDQEGKFTFDGLAVGQSRLRIEGTSHANHQELVTLETGTNQLNVDLPAGGVVKGTAVDGQSKPKGGVVIMVFPEALENYLWTTTESDGTYAVNNVPAGPLRITARSSEKSAAEIRVEHKAVMEVGHDLVWDPQLVLKNHVSGIVIFADTKAPMPYTQIYAIPVDKTVRKKMRHAQTDLKGRFHLQDLIQDDHRLHIRVLPYNGAYTKMYAVDLPDLPLVRPGMADLVIEIPRSQIPSSFLIGQAIKRSSKVSLEGLELRAHRAKHLTLKHPINSADGSFNFGPIPTGDYVIELTSSRLGSKILAPRKLDPKERAILGKIEMEEPGFALVNITEAEGAELNREYIVSTSGRVVWSQSTPLSEVRIGPLQPGDYDLQVTHKGSNHLQTFTIRSGTQNSLTLTP